MQENSLRHEEIKMGSERSFGYVMGIFFTLIGVIPLFFSNPINVWSCIIAAALFLLATIKPRLLKPLNLLWFKFGMMLHKITNPIIMGIIFFVTIVPTASIFKLLKKDVLGLRFKPDAKSYWISRNHSGPAQNSMKDQF